MLNGKRKIKICKLCDKETEVPQSLADRPFCDSRCMAKWMSVNQRGRNHWNWQGGKWKRYCIVCEKEFEFDKGDLKRRNVSRIFCSISCKAKYHSIKERNPNWKGGIQPENLKIRNSRELREWKIKCLERDNHSCQNCGSIEYLHVHHIKPFYKYKELRSVLENGVTLCLKCHYELHSKLSRGKNRNSKT